MRRLHGAADGVRVHVGGHGLHDLDVRYHRGGSRSSAVARSVAVDAIGCPLSVTLLRFGATPRIETVRPFAAARLDVHAGDALHGLGDILVGEVADLVGRDDVAHRDAPALLLGRAELSATLAEDGDAGELRGRKLEGDRETRGSSGRYVDLTRHRPHADGADGDGLPADGHAVQAKQAAAVRPRRRGGFRYGHRRRGDAVPVWSGDPAGDGARVLRDEHRRREGDGKDERRGGTHRERR